MRIVLFSTIYPNIAQPNFGIFTHMRAINLRRLTGAEVIVIAPIPRMIPPFNKMARYKYLARIPKMEFIDGIKVYHPEFLSIPYLGWIINPYAIARSAVHNMREICREFGKFDVIDAHYIFPDGVAASYLSEAFSVPLVCTALGSDVTYWAKRRIVKFYLSKSIQNVSAYCAVSSDLSRQLEEIDRGFSPVHTLRNCVDLERFCPIDRAESRKSLKMNAPTILSVGALIPRKGHDLTISALAKMNDVSLWIVGTGPELENLKRLAEALKISNRVNFLGEIPNEELRKYYSAADLMVLASSREGLANVLLESIACGCPIVSTLAEGSMDVLNDKNVGTVVKSRTANALSEAIMRELSINRDREKIRESSMRFSWPQTTNAHFDILAKSITTYRIFSER